MYTKKDFESWQPEEIQIWEINGIDYEITYDSDDAIYINAEIELFDDESEYQDTEYISFSGDSQKIADFFNNL